MAIKTIQFTGKDGKWEHEFTFDRKVAVQIDTVSDATIYIMASMGDGMKRALMGELYAIGASVMFDLEFPSGTKLAIVSSREVTKAVMTDV